MSRRCTFFVVVLAVGCQRPPETNLPEATASSTGSADPRGYPGTLRSPAAFGPDFQWQQHVVAHWNGRAHPFDAVLSKNDQELLLIGLGPMKTPGFVVTLRDREVQFENRTQREVPFDPDYIMLDVQRVYFPWLEGPVPDDGVRSATLDGEVITERFEGGQLVERTFRREDERPPGTIVVRYRGWEAGARAPRFAELDNGWFGYRLEIETLVQQLL